MSSARVSIAVLLYLRSIGLVGGVTAGLFFGSGFLLLDQPSEQMQAGSRVHGGNTEVSPSRPGGSSASVENGTPFGGDFPVLGSTANGAAPITPAQTAAPNEAEASWKATSTPPPFDGSDQFRKISRASNSRSDSMLGKARTAARRIQSTKPDRKQEPEESEADSANQQEYNQLHAAGPAINLAADAVEPLASRQSEKAWTNGAAPNPIRTASHDENHDDCPINQSPPSVSKNLKMQFRSTSL